MRVGAGASLSLTISTGWPEHLTFRFDLNGSTLSDAVNSYAYDARGRMVQATSSAGTSTFQVNALGQRRKHAISSRQTNRSTRNS